MPTYILADVIIIAALAFSAFLGYRKGFVLTLCSFLAVFVAYFGANMTVAFMEGPLTRTLQPGLESVIQRVLDEKISEEDLLSGSSSSGSASAPEQHPAASTDSSSSTEEDPRLRVSLETALDVLKETSFYRGFAENLEEMLDRGLETVENNAARTISTFISTQVARAVLFYLSFILILCLWHMLSHVLNLAFRLPVLSALNAWTGAAVGLLRGAAIAMIVCFLLGQGLLAPSLVEKTVVLKFFTGALAKVGMDLGFGIQVS